MKQPSRLMWLICLLLGSAIVIGAGVYGAQYYFTTVHADTIACHEPRTTHLVTIKNNQLSNTSIQASPCDTLIITNDDDQLRLIAFGTHDHHQSYDGITQQILKKDESLTVTLNQPGTFTFHDHLHDELTGTFIVSP